MPPILCVPPKSVRACACARGTVRKSANACSTSFPGTSASVFRAGIRLSRNFFPNPSPPAPNRLSRSGGRGALRRHPGALTTGWTCWPGMLAPIPAPARRICAWPTCLSRRCPPPCSNNGTSCTASRWRRGSSTDSPAPCTGDTARGAIRSATAIWRRRDHRTRTAGSHTSCARWRDSSRGRIPSRRGVPVKCPYCGMIPICSRPGGAWAS